MKWDRPRRSLPVFLGAAAAASLMAAGCAARSWAPAVSLGVTAKRVVGHEPADGRAGMASGWSAVGTLRLQLLGPSAPASVHEEGVQRRSARPVHAEAPCRLRALCRWETAARRRALRSFGVVRRAWAGSP